MPSKNSDMVSSLQKVQCHRTSHDADADKSNLHTYPSFVYMLLNYSISTMAAPPLTTAPSCTYILRTLPAQGAEMECSIFIALRLTSTWRCSTLSPSWPST